MKWSKTPSGTFQVELDDEELSLLLDSVDSLMDTTKLYGIEMAENEEEYQTNKSAYRELERIKSELEKVGQ